MPPLYEVEIFKAGTRPASNGAMTTISTADLQEVVDTYNPNFFRAPLIVSKSLGHDIGNYTDKSVSKSEELCHGIPKTLKLVGDRLVAGFDKISKNFAQWVRGQEIHSVSSSFYLPDSPNNPYPGKWSLRHVAGLGATPPACKGLAPLPNPPADWNEFEPCTINFDESEEGVVDFIGGLMMGGSPWAIAADLFQRYREYLIESEDLETADRVLPSDQIAALRDMAQNDAWKDQQIAQLQMQVAQLQQDEDDEDDEGYMGYGEMSDYKKMWKQSGMSPAEVAQASGLSEQEVTDICANGKPPTPKQKKALDGVFSSSDMSEELEQREADLKAREEAIVNRERALEYREVASFVEGLVDQGKVIAAKKEDTITLLLNTPNQQEVEFSQATGKKTPRQVLMSELSDRPAWNFRGTIVRDEQDPVNPNFGESIYVVPGSTSASVKDHQAVVGWCKKNSKDPNKAADYSEGMIALGIHNHY